MGIHEEEISKLEKQEKDIKEKLSKVHKALTDKADATVDPVKQLLDMEEVAKQLNEHRDENKKLLGELENSREALETEKKEKEDIEGKQKMQQEDYE